MVQRLVLVVAIALLMPVATAACVSCPTGLLTGVLTQQADELVVIPDGGGPAERLIWPSGHGIRADDDTLVVTDLFGIVRARAGDSVRLGGGERDSETWVVCGQFEAEPHQTVLTERSVACAAQGPGWCLSAAGGG
jgi:hypothetical protein